LAGSSLNRDGLVFGSRPETEVGSPLESLRRKETAMAKDKWDPFSGVVCERLRRLRDKGSRWKGQREKMFKARDAADAALNETAASESGKRSRLLSDYGEAVRKIKDLDHKIRDAERSIDETILHADQAELFEDPDTFTPPADEAEGEGETAPENEKANATPVA